MKTKLILVSFALLLLGSAFFVLKHHHEGDLSKIRAMLLLGLDQHTQTQSSTSTAKAANYKDGTYTGSSVFNGFGNVQVKAVIAGGKISDIQYLSLPSDASTSQYISSQAGPMLKQEAIQVQSASVDTISGATATSDAFQQSLQSALTQAHS